jgi:ElaB/YqjD/DUF883 family membrane-anchored ribosome-binding protein
MKCGSICEQGDMADTPKLDKLQSEAEEHRQRFETALSGLSRKARPTQLADRAVGRLGPAADIYARLSYVAERNPWMTVVFAASAGWLVWQFLRSGSGLIRVPVRRELRTTPKLRPVGLSSQSKENLHGNVTTHDTSNGSIIPQ